MMIINGARHPSVTDFGIYGFFQEFRFLSNFHILPTPITSEGFEFWTTEAAYMAYKTHDVTLKLHLASISRKPNAAKTVGRSLVLRPDWEEVKDEAMLNVTRLKYKIPELQMLLDKTTGKYLEETNNWGDSYWGAAVKPEGFPGTGLNKLGKTLMQVRSETSMLITF